RVCQIFSIHQTGILTAISRCHFSDEAHVLLNLWRPDGLSEQTRATMIAKFQNPLSLANVDTNLRPTRELQGRTELADVKRLFNDEALFSSWINQFQASRRFWDVSALDRTEFTPTERVRIMHTIYVTVNLTSQFHLWPPGPQAIRMRQSSMSLDKKEEVFVYDYTIALNLSAVELIHCLSFTLLFARIVPFAIGLHKALHRILVLRLYPDDDYLAASVKYANSQWRMVVQRGIWDAGQEGIATAIAKIQLKSQGNREKPEGQGTSIKLDRIIERGGLAEILLQPGSEDGPETGELERCGWCMAVVTPENASAKHSAGGRRKSLLVSPEVVATELIST